MTALRVLLDEKLAAPALPLFRHTGMQVDVEPLKSNSLEALVRRHRYAALVVREKVRIPAPAMEAAGPSLRVIGVVGDTLHNVNVTEATRLGVLVKITEYGNTFEVANLAKQLMVLLLSESFRPGRRRKAYVVEDIQDMLAGRYTGFELADKSVGLIGCGRVAQALALMIHPHCEKVLGYDKHLRAVYEDFHLTTPLERPVIEYCQLSEIMEKSDIISIHTSGQEQIFLIDGVFQSRRKPYIINTARDAAINEEALLAALADGRIRGAAFTLPLREIKKAGHPEDLVPYLPFGNLVIAQSPGRPVGDAHKKNIKALSAAVIAYLLEEDLHLAVNPPEIFGRPTDMRYPLSRRTRRASLPLRI